MKNYEEKDYEYNSIRKSIYPLVKNRLYDSGASNGGTLSEEDTIAISFAGELKVIFAVKGENEEYEIMKDSMLPGDVSAEELYHEACENLVRDVEFVIANTWYGAFGIIADGMYEASALCFRHIWQVCVDKLKDDLIIMAPAKDTVLFAPACDKKAVDGMKDHAESAYRGSRDKISMQQFIFSKTRKELTVYE